jgi:ribonuclease P protein component
MVLFVAPGTGRVAVVAGRRIGSAVRRNRARRILRAAWREIAARVGPDRDVVVVAKGSILEAKTQDLVAEMNRVIEEPSWAS